ncbi:MAG: hypothetical protein JXR71_07800 [Bacteroidales bacterium]|nr:hypothetical protein [Bacteroidales bacterium]
MMFKKIILIMCLGLIPAAALMAQDYEYIGAMKCKMCHNSPAKGNQYKIWKDSKHAHAMEALKGADATNPKCTKCHSTAASVSENLWAGITVKEGVSCESCHGPGSKYKSMSIMKDRKKALANGMIIPTEATCKKCHNSESPTFKGFDYKTALAKIAHPIPKH